MTTKRPPAPPSECTALPHITPTQEQALLERARVGEDVRDQILLSLQLRVNALAWRVMATPADREEQSDLVQSANIAMLKWFDTALCHPNPYRYLLRVARSAMFDFFRGCKEAYSQRERLPVVSLDAPLTENGLSLTDLQLVEHSVEGPSPQSMAIALLLHQAVEALPEKQRLVIQRHYGFEQEPQSLNAMKKELSAKYHHSKALMALRTALAAQFPQFAEGGVQ